MVIKHIVTSVRRPSIIGKVEAFHKAYVYESWMYQDHKEFIHGRPATPVTLVEAQALGTCAVSTKVGGIGEIVKNGHTGILVRSGNPCALAQAVRMLLQNEEERTQMGLNTSEWVRENFLLEKTVGPTVCRSAEHFSNLRITCFRLSP